MRGLQQWVIAVLAVSAILSGEVFAATGNTHIDASMQEIIGMPHSSSLASADESVAMSVDPQVAQGIFRRAATLNLTDFPLVDGKTVDLELERMRPVVDQNTRIHSGDREFRVPEVITFYGRVAGQYNSRVVLNYAGGDLIGSVELESGEQFSLAPALGQTKRANSDHVLRRSSGMNYDRHFQCGEEQANLTAFDDEHAHDDHEHAHESKGAKDKVNFEDLLEVEIAVETDSYLYQTLTSQGNDEEFLINYTISLVAMISALYEENINVTFDLTDINIYTDAAGGFPDPYNAPRGQLSTLLAQFSQNWATSKQSVRRDIAHIMSAYPSGGGVVGVAYSGGNSYTGTLCRKNAFTGYGASGIRFNSQTPTLDYTGDVAIMAHEIGHNFGAPHTHNCFWQNKLDGAVIDTCVTANSSFAADGCIATSTQRAAGTIMSYCHNVNSARTVSMVFHPLVREQMRRNAENASSCVTVASSPVILVSRPFANEHYSAGSTVDIVWTSERVNTVVLSYSIDDGENFTEIATVDALDRTYSWTVPFADTETALIRVADVRNENLYGQSYATFTIESPTLKVLTPNGGEEVAQNSEFDLRWQGILVESVSIEYSLNNGQDWELIESGVTGTFYAWIVPTVTSDQALIRVTDDSNPELSDVSDAPFTIGAATLTLTAPVGGEIWPLGEERMINWDSRFVSHIRIEYTVDDGENWNVVHPRVSADDGQYSWSISSNPELASDLVRVRLRDLDSQDGLISMSPNTFTLSILTSVNSEEQLGFSAMVQPNPVSNQAQLIISSENPLNLLNIRVVNVLGNTVLTLPAVASLPTGESRIQIDSSELAPGAYFLLLESDKGTLQRPFNVVR